MQVSEHIFTLSLSHTHLHLPAAHALCHVHDARHHEQTSSCPGKDLRPRCILGHVNSHKMYIAWSSHITPILSGIPSSLRTWAPLPIKGGMTIQWMRVHLELLRKVEPLDNFFCLVNAGDPPPAKDNLPYQTPKKWFPRWISPIYLLQSRHHGPGWPCTHSLLMQRLEAKIWEITSRNSPPCPPANPIARVISNLGWLLLYENKPPNDLWKNI